MSLLAQALVGLFAAAVCASAESHTLSLVVSTEVLQTGSVFEELKRETARLVSPADYSFAWLEKGRQAMGDSFEQVVVVQFRGACLSQGESGTPAGDTHSLATTAVSDGQVLPFINVDCDRTRRLVSGVLANLPGGARDVLFGRALGRVLAHELYHVLAQTTAHKDQGVSKPCFRLTDLISTRFRFDPVSLAQMRPASQLSGPARAGDNNSTADDVAGR